MKRIFVCVTVIALSLVTPGFPEGTKQFRNRNMEAKRSEVQWVNVQPPKSETRTIETQGQWREVYFRGVAADGSHFEWGFTTNYDGKDSAIPVWERRMGRCRGPHTRGREHDEGDNQEGRQTDPENDAVVSSDGKVTILTSKGTNAQGHATSSTTVLTSSKFVRTHSGDQPRSQATDFGARGVNS